VIEHSDNSSTVHKGLLVSPTHLLLEDNRVLTMSGARHWEQDKDSTIYIGNLDERVTDSLVWELFLQAGRIVNVHLPKDRVTQSHQGYGFVEFNSEEERSTSMMKVSHF